MARIGERLSARSVQNIRFLKISDFHDFLDFGPSGGVFFADFCAGAALPRNFKLASVVYVACRAGIKRYRPARRVILLVAAGVRGFK